MESLPLSLLALAAGVYLLIKVKREYLGGLFSVLAWLVIVASLVSVVCASFECFHECCGRDCGDRRECRVEKQVIIKDGKEESCTHISGGGMGCCKMEGDSVVMEKEACEKIMGKEACDAMCKERGRCILSKDECVKMCHSKETSCCAEKSEPTYTKKCEASEKKECCKKKTE